MESKRSLLAVKDLLIDLVFPRVCVSCGKPDENLCTLCKQSISHVFGSKLVPDIDELIFIWRYDNRAVKSLIKSLKYDFITSLESDLRSILDHDDHVSRFRDFCSSGCLVPVPLHKKRELWRGFNQSAVIAQIISEMTGLPARNDLIRRVAFTEQQAHLGLDERLLNLNGAFKATETSILTETVILVDDVVTTGATLSAIAQELKKKGFLHIKAVVLAA